MTQTGRNRLILCLVKFYLWPSTQSFQCTVLHGWKITAKLKMV